MRGCLGGFPTAGGRGLRHPGGILERLARASTGLHLEEESLQQQPSRAADPVVRITEPPLLERDGTPPGPSAPRQRRLQDMKPPPQPCANTEPLFRATARRGSLPGAQPSCGPPSRERFTTTRSLSSGAVAWQTGSSKTTCRVLCFYIHGSPPYAVFPRRDGGPGPPSCPWCLGYFLVRGGFVRPRSMNSLIDNLHSKRGYMARGRPINPEPRPAPSHRLLLVPCEGGRRVIGPSCQLDCAPLGRDHPGVPRASS